MPPAVASIVVAICTFEHPAVPFNTTFILFAGSAPAGAVTVAVVAACE